MIDSFNFFLHTSPNPRYNTTMKFTNQSVTDAFETLQGHIEQNSLDKKILMHPVFKELYGSLKSAKPESKASLGKEINELKNYYQEQLKEQSENQSFALKTPIDVTADMDLNQDRILTSSTKGSLHPIVQESKKIYEIFKGMGFDIVESRQLDNDYNMFEALNFPPDHPARGDYDSFKTEEGLIPPAHTSTMQNRVISSKPGDVAAIIPGRVYRNEATDANHEHTFYQVEGVFVGKDISVGNMFATFKTFLEKYFEMEIDTKMQPAFFPFTEPDIEFLMSCPFCNKTGCKVCGHGGYMEIVGCGMIHPNVLRMAGKDPEVYTGFAWGFGLDRLVMIKNGIEDIRHLHSGNLDFLTQF